MSRKLAKRELDISQVVFSDKSAKAMSSVLGIKPEQRDGFRSAYRLLPLSQVKECIDMAYRLSLDGMDGVEAWLERYIRLAQRELPKWARKNSKQYIVRTHVALNGGSRERITDVLFEFKGFIYAVFCRALIEYYNEVKNGSSAANTGKSDS